MAALALKEAGNNAFKRGNYDEAIICYGEAMKLDPSESTYPLNRSMAYLKLQRYTEAERDASKSLNLLPAGNVKALFRRALARRAQGRLDMAKQDLQAALEEEPSNQGVKAELASLETEIGDRKTSDLKKGKAKESSSTAPVASQPSAAPAASNKAAKHEKLKAAITPEYSTETDKEPALLAPVSTRVLRSPGNGIASSISTESSASMSQRQSSSSTSTAAKKDFLSMRSEREQRIKATAAALKPVTDSRMIPKTDEGRIDISKTLARTSLRPPQSTFEFERRWKDSPDQPSRMGILESMFDANTSLPDLFGSNLSPEVVDDILSCLKQSDEARDTAWYFLENLPRCRRFDFVSMLSGETSAIRQIVPPDDERSSSICGLWGV